MHVYDGIWGEGTNGSVMVGDLSSTFNIIRRLQVCNNIIFAFMKVIQRICINLDRIMCNRITGSSITGLSVATLRYIDEQTTL